MARIPEQSGSTLAARVTGVDGRANALEQHTAGWVNLESYRHLVVADDWTAAMTAACATGKHIRLPERNITTGPFTLASGQSMFGAGRNSVLLVKSGTTGNFLTLQDGGQFNRLSDFWIYSEEGDAVGVFLSHAYRVKIDHLQVIGCDIGLDADGFQGVDLESCRFSGNWTLGVRTRRTNVDALINPWFSITNSFIESNGAGVWCADTADVHLINTRVILNQDYGVKLTMSAAQKAAGRLCTNAVIEQGDIDSNWNAALQIIDQTDFTVSNTWIGSGRTESQSSYNPAGQGIYLYDSANGDISSCRVYDNGGNGIQIDGTSHHINIIGGSVRGSGGVHGIVANAGDGIKVQGVTVRPAGSVFTTNQQNGITIVAGDHHIVTGNASFGHSGNNVSVAGSNSITANNAVG